MLASAQPSRFRRPVLNEILRRALFRARLAEEDVAAVLGVDPKTVRRWLEGRLPYPRFRWTLANLLNADEGDLWPEVRAARAARSRPDEIRAVYPHRRTVPRHVWHQLFESAQHEINVLDFSALFLAEGPGLLEAVARKATDGIAVRIALQDPDTPPVTEPSTREGSIAPMATKIRNALSGYTALLDTRNIEIRVHRTTLYNSLFRADDDLLVSQHAYGIPPLDSPVFHLLKTTSAVLFESYRGSWEYIWSSAVRIHSEPWR